LIKEIILPEKLRQWQELPEAVDMKDDMAIIYQAVLTNEARNILELGCGGGLSTRALALAAEFLSSGSEVPRVVVSVDIDPEKINNVRQKVKDADLEKYAVFTNEDSVNFLQRNCQQTTDFIFIDTDHTFKQTLAEITLSAAVISSKGYIFLHDTRYPGVWQALTAFMRLNNSFTFIDYNTASGLGLLMRKYAYWIPTNVSEERK
jgi:predicted O-methyltransferase YrrM